MNDGIMISKGKQEKLRDIPGPVPLGLSRISHVVTGD